MGLAFPKPQPSVLTKHAKRKAADKALEDAYVDVDARDGGVCWVTGRFTASGAVDARVRREHHHLVPRSRAKLLIYSPHNIITVSAEAHQLITAGWIVVEGSDARQPIFFHWAAHVEHKDKPFVIKARREVEA